MQLHKDKVIALIKARLAAIEVTYKKDLQKWKADILEHFEDEVRDAEKTLQQCKTDLNRAGKASYCPEKDPHAPYKLPKPQLSPNHAKLKELVEVLETASESEIKVTPQIERALGLKW